MSDKPDPIPFPRAANLDAAEKAKGSKETRALGQVLGEIIQRLERIEQQRATRDPELSDAIKRIEGFLYIDMKRAVADSAPQSSRRGPVLAVAALCAAVIGLAFVPQGTFDTVKAQANAYMRVAADRISGAWSLDPNSGTTELSQSSEAELVRR